MTPSRFVIVPDLHLGVEYKRTRCNFSDPWRFGLLRVAELLIKLGTEEQWGEETAIIFAGDLWHSPRARGNSILLMRQVRDALEALKVPLYAISGNHDHDAAGSLHEALGIPTAPADWPYVGVYPYMPKTELREKMRRDARPILILHAAYKKMLAFEGAYDFDDEDINPSTKLIVTGHIHAAQHCRTAAGCDVISVGTATPTASDQAFGSILVFSSEKMEQHALFPNYRDRIALTLDAVRAEMQADPEGAWLLVNVPTELYEQAHDLICESETPVLLVPLKDQATLDVEDTGASADLAHIADPDDLVKQALADENASDSAKHLLSQLIAAQDPKETLEQWVTHQQ